MYSKLIAGSIFALHLGNALAGVQFAGVNIAGFDFGCGIDGKCTVPGAVPPLKQFGGHDGAGQMKHFTADHKMNFYRLPVGWQFLVNNQLGGPLNTKNFEQYDDLVTACLTTGSRCLIDIHNYARWNGGIIGQGGPTNKQFSSLWSQLATKYASEPNVVMGIMNEPHNVNIDTWAETVQAAVTAIRQAGATKNLILLPGNGYTGAGGFVPGGSAAALNKVTNLDGSTDNLVFDVHMYLDGNGSGSIANCVQDGIESSLAPLADWLGQNKTHKRMAFLSETGGGPSDPSCLKNVCAALSYMNKNSDVYLGWTGWAAGSFATSYGLSLTPTETASGWTDVPLLKQCFAGEFDGGAGVGNFSSETTGNATGGSTGNSTSGAEISTSSTSLATGLISSFRIGPSVAPLANSSASTSGAQDLNSVYFEPNPFNVFKGSKATAGGSSFSLPTRGGHSPSVVASSSGPATSIAAAASSSSHYSSPASSSSPPQTGGPAASVDWWSASGVTWKIPGVTIPNERRAVATPGVDRTRMEQKDKVKVVTVSFVG